jgi:hypothetical protein
VTEPDDDEENKLSKINIPVRLYPYLTSTVVVSSVDVTEESMEEPSRTELDTHANMPVVGRNAYIISDTGRVADVSPFSPDYDSMMIPIVDAAVSYLSQDGKLYILVIRNALHVPAMEHNLLPPFVMREAGIKVNDTPKIQTTEPVTEEDHSIFFHEDEFRIPLSLYGMFSYFPTSKPTAEQMMESENVYLLTPTRMNPIVTRTPQTRRTWWTGKGT